MLNFNRKKRAEVPRRNEVATVSTAVIMDDTEQWHTRSDDVQTSNIPYIRNDGFEIIVKYVPAGATLHAKGGGARILVLGNVGRGAELVADGGGARIEVLGNVASAARIGAIGGDAHVMILGTVASSAAVVAKGGGARVEFFSPSAPHSHAHGGGAEVLHL